MSHCWRLPSAVRIKAPFRVPTSRRTPLIAVASCRIVDRPGLGSTSAPFFRPPGADRLERNLAAALGAERLRSGGAPLEAPEPSECGGRGVSNRQRDAPPNHACAFSRSMAGRTRRANGIGTLQFVHLPFPLAHETVTKNLKDDALT